MTTSISRRAVMAGIASGGVAMASGRAGGTERTSHMKAPAGSIKTGADIWAADGFSALAGRRVGLITNHTGLAGGRPLAGLMHAAPGVTLAAILAPEHGFLGTAEAGIAVRDGVDTRTRVPVLSLYGATRRPTAAMLRGLDALVFDIQDIGVRYYTYISTMGLAMQSAAAAGIPFFVLDRPNPLGGAYVAGFTLEARQRSFVGQYAIPQVHGLTVAELAAMIKGERLLPGLAKLDLQVVAMTGWKRGMRWPLTGAAWVPTSPNIPTFETALLYAGTGLFEATAASDGRGTRTPFALLGAPWVADGRRLAERVMRAAPPGVRIAAASFTPRAIARMAQRPRHEGSRLTGVRVTVTDAQACRPVETAMHLLAAFSAEAQSAGGVQLVTDTAAFARLAGTTNLERLLRKQAPADDIIAAWDDDVRRFVAARAPYLLYQT